RGEIAVSIIQACRDMGILSVALFADDDIGSMHVELAEEAWGLAGATASETYLNFRAIIEVAKKSKATMV
ncbi:biotin carboxylase N-terminal domain-containing protein, partial [Acinetobacter calcoaceticus]|uniref:biotin carboxylase N-terminal domain-containing protein n=1 Tax=Acinetobacter calcoaceticus TaxID=471 RepID=UPI003F7CB35E